jgi:hypothetical protein
MREEIWEWKDEKELMDSEEFVVVSCSLPGDG